MSAETELYQELTRRIEIVSKSEACDGGRLYALYPNCATLQLSFWSEQWPKAK